MKGYYLMINAQIHWLKFFCGSKKLREFRRMLTNIDSKDDIIGNLLYKSGSGRQVQKRNII